MKKFILAIVAGLTPFLMINPTSAADTAAPVAETPAQAEIPSLTFYYFDG